MGLGKAIDVQPARWEEAGLDARGGGRVDGGGGEVRGRWVWRGWSRDCVLEIWESGSDSLSKERTREVLE